MKHWRLRIFEALLGPFSAMTRQRRMALFERQVRPVAGMRILDLGGQPEIWDGITTPLQITCLNLPGIARSTYASHHDIRYLEGDACSMPHIRPGDFDLVFSNSVIEHVGDLAARARFAKEVLRLDAPYWIQTPSIWFPIEAHCGMPFWWFYPASLRAALLRRWHRSLPAWTDMVAGTVLVSRGELRSLFPQAAILTEWFLLPKSHIAFSAGSGSSRPIAGG